LENYLERHDGKWHTAFAVDEKGKADAEYDQRLSLLDTEVETLVKGSLRLSQQDVTIHIHFLPDSVSD
jgi:hypothetical protein